MKAEGPDNFRRGFFEAISHKQMPSGELPQANVLPSGEKATAPLLEPHGNSKSLLPEPTSQRRMLFSAHPVKARVLPSGEKATEQTEYLCAGSSRSFFPVAVSQNWIRASVTCSPRAFMAFRAASPMTSVLPLGEKARHMTPAPGSSAHLNAWTCLPVATSHRYTLASE